MQIPWRFLLVVGGLLALLRYTLGGGERLEDRTGEPVLKEAALEVVADLPLPPGNIAVSKSGRVFFTFHPEDHPADLRCALRLRGEALTETWTYQWSR